MVYRPDCRYLPYSILFSEFLAIFLHEKTDETRKYAKSAIFVSYENGRRRLLGAQSINTERRMPPQQILDEREKDVVCLKNGSRLDGLRFNNSQQQCMETVFGRCLATAFRCSMATNGFV